MRGGAISEMSVCETWFSLQPRIGEKQPMQALYGFSASSETQRG